MTHSNTEQDGLRHQLLNLELGGILEYYQAGSKLTHRQLRPEDVDRMMQLIEADRRARDIESRLRQTETIKKLARGNCDAPLAHSELRGDVYHYVDFVPVTEIDKKIDLLKAEKEKLG